MPKRWIQRSTLVALIIWIGLLSATTSGVSDPAIERDVGAKIEAIVATIHKVGNAEARIQAAEGLSTFVRSQERTSLDNLGVGTIAAIASLLRDRLDTVKYWAAITLGDIGPTASPAVPALESAAKYIEPAFESPIIGKIGVSSSAASTILDALRKIRGEPTEPARKAD